MQCTLRKHSLQKHEYHVLLIVPFILFFNFFFPFPFFFSLAFCQGISTTLIYLSPPISLTLSHTTTQLITKLNIIMSCVQSWPEPIVRVQSLSESGIRTIPDRYIKHLSDRPLFTGNSPAVNKVNIPTIDLNNLFSGDGAVRRETCEMISGACREWGFFQVINHGVDLKLMGDMQEAWREFFHLPLEEKQRYANSPTTYEGYGSRLGVVKEAKLDWSDYFFLHFLPEPLKDPSKWPRLPVSCRELVAKYGEEVVELCEKLTRILSVSLGLKEDALHQAFGGDENRGACLRVNFYPKCPQPDLTLGISPHSDPGGMTLLLPDADVAGLQVRHAGQWVTVKPVPNAFIVNMGDQMQVLYICCS
nr:leucoanthocyanidin dioxygenase-like [Ipomoea batatas]